MQKVLHFFIFATAIFVASSVNGQSLPAKKLIVGAWKLNDFELTGDFAVEGSKEYKDSIVQANLKANAGVVLKFTSNGNYTTTKTSAGKTVLVESGRYKVSDDGKYIVTGKNEKLTFLSPDKLRGASAEAPTMIFKRVK